MNRRDVDCSHLFALEPLFRRWPRATAVAAVLFVLLANGLGGAIDSIKF